MYSITSDGVAGMEQRFRAQTPARQRGEDQPEIDPDDDVRAKIRQCKICSLCGTVQHSSVGLPVRV